jgi:hypothetical protein
MNWLSTYLVLAKLKSGIVAGIVVAVPCRIVNLNSSGPSTLSFATLQLVSTNFVHLQPLNTSMA